MNSKTKFIFHTAFLLVSLKLQSQTLTCQYNCPQIGELFSTKTSSPVVHTSGQNQLWDFTQVQAVSTNVSIISYVDPLSAPSSSLYPQASVAKVESGTYTFLNTGSTGIKLVSPASATVNTQSLLLPLPFFYGSTHSETIITTYMSGSDTIKVTSTKNINGIGTGTLMLPTNTYTDVLSISGQLVESQTKNGVADGYIYITALNYYYSEKIAHPLLYSSYKFANGPIDFVPFTQFISDTPTGLKNESKVLTSEMIIAPNPTSDVVRITTPISEEGEIILSNTLGEILLRKNHSAGTTELKLSELPEGLYTLLIKQQGNVQSKKLVVSR